MISSNSQIKQIFKYEPDALGYGTAKSAWSSDGNLVAVCGDNKIIRIMDRQGKPVLTFPSNQTPRIDDLAWDKDSDSLAILTASNMISIWSMGQSKFQDIELGSSKDIASYISWSKTNPVLCIGTEKGSLTFFNRKSQRKIPCITKHGKKVTTGDWSNDGYLMSASGSDRMLTVSNQNGDTPFDSFIVPKGEPTNVRWSPIQDENNKMLCCIIGG
jgi:WD40 repeat protein